MVVLRLPDCFTAMRVAHHDAEDDNCFDRVAEPVAHTLQ